MGTSNLTDCGVPAVGKIPWGSHFCHFFAKREDLIHGLVPYFQAGLRNNERCIWITSDPLRSEEATQELRRAMPDLDSFIDKGQIKILDFDRWYTSADSGVRGDLVGQWVAEEKAALEAGYAGLRVAGNTSFLDRAQWPAFMKYEGEVNRRFAGQRIIALCSYDLRNSRGLDLFDVVRNHRFTLDRKGESWEVVEMDPKTSHRPFPG
jgi:hypothetical protein